MWRIILETLDFANLLIDAVLDRKGSDILLLDMQDQVLFADYFLLCNGDSNRQIQAMVNAIRDEAKQEGGEVAQSVEGHPDDGWMCVDFGHLVAHIFEPASREYYNLEELWQDARVVVRIA